MMAKTSNIEWTDATWNPWMGCTKVSPGCKNCYMFRDQKRYGHDPTVLRRSKTTFRDPLKWKEPKRIFVCSWGDFFHPDVPREWRKDAMDIMFHASQHTFLILTKRPDFINLMIDKAWWGICQNVWLGISAENQETYDARLPWLLRVPASHRFISAEPLLGSIGLKLIFRIPDEIGRDHSLVGEHISWVITGGESDFRNPRLCNLDWVRSIRDQCIDANEICGNVSFFHKQHGGSKKTNGTWGGRELDGRTWDEVP